MIRSTYEENKNFRPNSLRPDPNMNQFTHPTSALTVYSDGYNIKCLIVVTLKICEIQQLTFVFDCLKDFSGGKEN